MSGLLQKILGGQAPAQAPAAHVEDADFADFAGAPDPTPISIAASITASASAQAVSPTAGGQPLINRPYTKWYRVWERTTIKDFYAELYIVPFILVLAAIHLWGSRKNKRKAKAWVAAHSSSLQEEFASFGFSGIPTTSLGTDALSDVSKLDSLDIPILKEKAANEYLTYATGRQNVAFLDVKLTLAKRYNPMAWFAESATGFFFESMAAPVERMEATNYPFDGRENDLVPVASGDVEGKSIKANSTYDSFVWAVVHKDKMRKLRNDRYDISLTTTKDHPKLPDWATVMTESAEITDALLTADLIKAVEQAGDAFEALVLSDQPIDQPKKLEDTTPRKRISLFVMLPASNDYTDTLPIFRAFLRLPDKLVAQAHFRPEVTRRIRNTREDAIRKIKKVDDDEKAEERRTKAEKERKERRDEQLKGMSAEAQRKFLEKERAKDVRRSQTKRTIKS